MSEYVKLSDIEHILNPDTADMYVGSMDNLTEEQWIPKNDMHKFEFINIDYVPALYKIFDEICVNARDQFTRYPDDLTNIRFDWNAENGIISIFNDGPGFRIYEDEKEKMYSVEMVLTQTKCGSNFNKKDKTTGGKYGYGAKLTTIFSSYFKVETVDESRKLKYEQIFKNNLSIIEDPQITKYTKKPYTRLTFIPDYAKFGMAGLNNEDIIRLFEKRAYDISACTNAKVKVHLNGNLLPIKTFNDYISLYIGKEPRVSESNERWEIAVADTISDNFMQVSFVNGVNTFQGGTHVEYIANQIARKLKAELVKRNAKYQNITPNIIKSNMFVFVNSIINDPTFNSQTKGRLETSPKNFGSVCNLSAKFIEDVCKKLLIARKCVSQLNAKEQMALVKTSGKIKSQISVPKLEDAKNAGTKKSADTYLILTEGDSAKSLAMAGIKVIGSENFGVFPLRGKLLNVRGANMKRVLENEEINHLKTILGLEHNKIYTDASQLRYGHILIFTDADVDGSHIKGLIINFIHYYWPSLMKNIPSFITAMRTPMIKAIKGKQMVEFFSKGQYDQWLEKNSANGWNIKYYKGLGTSTSLEAQDYFKRFDDLILEFTYNGKKDDSRIELAFANDKADARKAWLKHYDPYHFTDNSKHQISLSEFIDDEFIHYSTDDNSRSIPNVIDGLKEGQRKIIFAAFKKGINKDIKIAQFGAYVAEVSSYHHGEKSVQDTITKMTQNFVGSNNIELLEPSGQCGCLSPNTYVLLWDGYIKQARDIKIGDLLIDDKGNPTAVKQLTCGRDQMYKISHDDNSYIVNSQHILTLICKKHKVVVKDVLNGGYDIHYFDGKNMNVYHTNDVDNILSKIPDNNVFDISIENYMKFHPDVQKLFCAVYNYTPINWEKKPVKINPYILGFWIGNNFHNLNDDQWDIFYNYICNELQKYNPNIINNCVILDREFAELIDKNGYNNISGIKDEYLGNSIENRLELLAGLIDAIGVINNSIEIKNALLFCNENVINSNIQYLVHSLGYNIKPIIYGFKISGENLDKIPSKLHRREIANLSFDCQFCDEITIENAGYGEFIGWDVGGRFLLEKFTITHNSRLLGGKDAASPRYIYTRFSALTKAIFKEEDFPLLDYLEDEGLKIEPNYYVPIIPLILTNGAQGIGTGYSLNSPNYNPVDIANNLYNKLDGKKLIQMVPWYRNFSGNITKIANNKFITKGCYQIVKPNVIKITELPIGVWTTNYKEDFLETICITNKESIRKKLIKSYDNTSSNIDVEFTLTFIPDEFERLKNKEIINGCNGFELELKLVSKISADNVWLFDKDNTIKKYASPLKIIEEFYEIRIEYCKKRKAYILADLKSQLIKLQAKIKFIRSVVNGEIVINNKSREIIISMLENNEFPRLDKNSDDEEASSNFGGYRYLLGMPLYTLTHEKIVELQNEFANIKGKFTELKGKTAEDIYRQDLDEFRAAYDIFHRQDILNFNAIKNNAKNIGVKNQNNTRNRKK